MYSEQGFQYGSQRQQSQTLEVTEGKALNFESHKENLGVNDFQISTNGSPDSES